MDSIVLKQWITFCEMHLIIFPRTLCQRELLVSCQIYAELAFQCVFGDCPVCYAVCNDFKDRFLLSQLWE